MLLFRPSRPDFIETIKLFTTGIHLFPLFRPSRPDFIETFIAATQGLDVSSIVPAF